MLKSEPNTINSRAGFLNREKISRYKLEISIFAVFIFIYLFYLIGNPSVFTRFDIYYSFMSTIPFTGIMALALTLVVTLGEMDLSFPSVMAFSAWIFSILFANGVNIWAAALACLIMGAVSGLLNAFLVVKIGIPSLVATIASMFFFRGLVNVCASGQGISLVEAKNSILFDLCVGRIGGVIPAQAIWMLVLGVTFWFLFNRHRFGSHISFVGDNKDSALMMGINVNRVKTYVFALMGFFAAFAGILANLEVTFFWPSQGQGYLMTTMAAVFIGGTSVFGGKGTILGTFIGSLIIGSLEAGIVAIGLTGFWIQAIYGLIIMISVSIYALMMRKSE